jgi:thiol-disulfide isomerase/thioredoxin
VGDWVVVVVLGAATLFGLYRAASDGRFRGTHRVRGVSTGSTGPGSTGSTDQGPSHPADHGSTAGVSTGSTDRLTSTDLGSELGERATLLQFSSAFCAPCRATRHVLADVADVVPGVRHVEVDAESHLELVRRLSVLRTPTTLVLDAAGVEVTRATGAVRKQQVMAALAEAVQS